MNFTCNYSNGLFFINMEIFTTWHIVSVNTTNNTLLLVTNDHKFSFQPLLVSLSIIKQKMLQKNEEIKFYIVYQMTFTLIRNTFKYTE